MKSALRVRDSKDGVNGMLNWELNALEETDVVSLVLLLVTRSGGAI